MSSGPKSRLDLAMVHRHLTASRSQAESYIKLGKVKVNGQLAKKPGSLVVATDNVELSQAEQYVSRAALKLASVATKLNLDFNHKVVLDVGSSTGGFTDFALKHGAKKIIAVDVGTDQLHPSLRPDPKIELFEKTDIRDFKSNQSIDIVLIDTSFISLRMVLPAVKFLCSKSTQIVAMVKPQFEADAKQVNKGVIKNNTMRRQILKDFEAWAAMDFLVKAKADSEIPGAKGNLEKFYLLLVKF